MGRGTRLVILYVVLGICVLNAAAAIFTGKQPPEALYGVLGTLGAYVLMSGGNKDDDDKKKKKKRDSPQIPDTPITVFPVGKITTPIDEPPITLLPQAGVNEDQEEE